MWQRFTESARWVIFYSQEEAQKLRQSHVGPEHILLGLVRERDTTAGRALAELGIDAQQLRTMLESGDPEPHYADLDLTLTPQAKRVIDRAYDEARSFRNNFIGTEHLLLGLMTQPDGFVSKVFASFCADIHAARRVVKRIHEQKGIASQTASDPPQESQGQGSSKGSPMGWQKFNESARKVIFSAQEEAQRFEDAAVGPELLLLGLIKESATTAAITLAELGLTAQQIGAEIEPKLPIERAGRNNEMKLNTRGKRVVDLAYDEARNLENDYIGSEHLLLGLIRESGGLTGPLFAKSGVDILKAREIVSRLQSEKQTGDAQPKTPASTSTWQRYSELAKIAIFAASDTAERLNADAVTPEHLLAGILSKPGNHAGQLLARLGIDAAAIAEDLEMYLTHGELIQGEDKPAQKPELSPAGKRALKLAYAEAEALGHATYTTGHILLGLLRAGDGLAGKVLASFGVTHEAAQREYLVIQPHSSDSTESGT